MERGMNEMNGMKVNLSKTKVLVPGEEGEIIENCQFPCAVGGRGVGVSSKLYNSFNNSCHKRCSGLRSVKAPNFLCPSCSHQGGSSQPGAAFIRPFYPRALS